MSAKHKWEKKSFFGAQLLHLDMRVKDYYSRCNQHSGDRKEEGNHAMVDLVAMTVKHAEACRQAALSQTARQQAVFPARRMTALC